MIKKYDKQRIYKAEKEVRRKIRPQIKRIYKKLKEREIQRKARQIQRRAQAELDIDTSQ